MATPFMPVANPNDPWVRELLARQAAEEEAKKQALAAAALQRQQQAAAFKAPPPPMLAAPNVRPALPATNAPFMTPNPVVARLAAAQQGQPPAPKPVAAAAQAPQAFNGSGAWNPFGNYQTVPGGEPGAARDGGARRHAGRDYSGMNVGTPINAPPLGARLIEAGFREKDGNYGRWQLGDGSVMSIAHLANKPSEEIIGPGKPMAFLGNSGNASTRDTNRAVAHVRTWDASGNEIDPAQAFGGAAGPASGTPRTDSLRATIQGAMPAVPTPRMEGFNAMQGAIQQAARNDLAPLDFTMPTTPRPELPTPELQKGPDYTKADEAFAAARPKTPFGETPEEQHKAKRKLQWAGWLSGIGSALQRYQDGTGVGALLANAGGAALSGRLGADEDIRNDMEAFDQSMLKYNMAMSSREGDKANNAANIANANIQTMNQHANNKWQQSMKVWEEAQPSYNEQTGQLTTRVVNPDGSTKVHVSTIDPSAINKWLVAAAENEVARSSALTQGDQMQYRANVALTNTLLPSLIAESQSKGDFQTRDELIMYGATNAAHALADRGTWRDAMNEVPGGQAASQQLNTDAWASVGIKTMPDGTLPITAKPTEQQYRDYKKYIGANLVGFFMDTGHMHNLVGGMVQDILPGSEFEANGPRLPKGPERKRYAYPSQTVQQSVQAFNQENTKRTQRETAKGTFETQTFDPGF